MRVGIFTDSYRPYSSGVVFSIDLFTRDLTEMGHEISIFAPSYPHCEKESRIFRFISVPSPTNHDFCVAIPISLKLKRAMKKLKPDIIHVHSPFLLGRLGAKYARNLGVPLVFTFHTLYDQYIHYFPFAREVAREMTIRYYRDFCNNCDLVIAPTSVIADHLVENGVTTAIEAIRTGVDIERFDSRESVWVQRKYGLPEETRILLFVGRLGQEKNIPFLMEVYARVVDEHPDTRLVLVGAGPEEANLRRRARELGIQEKVIFAGKVGREEIANYYCSSYLFVFTSVTETQGLVLGEAKAAGVPAVAVRAFGVSEMVKDCEDGFLTEYAQADFKSKLELLLVDRGLRESMSQAARINSQSLSSRESAEKLIRCYTGLLNSGSRDVKLMGV